MSVASDQELAAARSVQVRDGPPRTSAGLSVWVYILAAVKFAVSIAFAGQYGFHRDELYYLVSGQHPSLGYVDYPPITPLLARVDASIFGSNLVMLRALPILAGSLIVILAGLTARELGGGRAAQGLAAFAILVSGIYLGGDWLFETVAFDQLVWAIVIFLFVKLLKNNSPRMWIAIGFSLGVGLETKYTILGLIAGIGGGIILTQRRRDLLTPWPWLALGLALLMLAPNLVWQVQHGWPSLSYLDTHHGRIAHDTSRTSFVLEQLLYVNIFLLPMVIAGLRFLFTSKVFRPLFWIPVIVELVFLVAGGKSYYVTPVFVLLYAAGATAVEPYLREGRARLKWSLALVPAIILILALLPIALPVLPAKTMAKMKLYSLRSDYGDMVGWPEFVRTIGHVYDTLPPAERAHTQILVGNYGEAGAIDMYGGRYHLPQALSGHLTFYYWKPKHVFAKALILVEVNPASLGGQCKSTEMVATITNSLGVQNEEYGNPVLLCRGNINLDRVWKRQLHYD